MTDQQPNDNIVADLYDNYHETQKEILGIEIRKTRIKLITIAVVIFMFDFISLKMLNIVNSKTLLIISVIPLVVLVLSMIAGKEPLLAMILVAVLIGGIWIYTIIKLGLSSAVFGWLSKAILIYLIMAGFQNAREAQRIKNELKV